MPHEEFLAEFKKVWRKGKINEFLIVFCYANIALHSSTGTFQDTSWLLIGVRRRVSQFSAQ
jgi:hypothetical protein